MNDFFTASHTTNLPKRKKKVSQFIGKLDYVSFSIMTNFELCPYMVMLSNVNKTKGVGSAALTHGTKIHDLLEQYVSGIKSKIDWRKLKTQKYHAPIIESFRLAHRTGLCKTELKLCFTKDMKESSWYAPDIWLRGAIDVILFDKNGYKATIYDYKTGSNQSVVKHRTQLMLYVLLTFIKYPELEAINATALYLDYKQDPFFTTYVRNDLDLYWPRFLARLTAVTDCSEFTPNPNGFSCRFCQHRITQESLGQSKPLCEFSFTPG